MAEGFRVRRRAVRNRFWPGLALGVTAYAAMAAAQQAGGTTRESTAALVEDLVAANRILVDQGVLDGYGHVSARHDADPNRYLLSRSLAPELVTSSDVLEFDLDSRPIDPRGRAAYREAFIHGEIYRARPDVMAVVHTHAPPLIPFSTSVVPLRPMYHMSAFVGEGVPVFDIRRVAGATDMLVTNAALGRALAETLGRRPAALMRGHGAAVVASSLPVVVGRSVYLKMNAELQLQAVALGGPIEFLSDDEARLAAPLDGYERAWELWKRKVSQ